MRYPKVAGRYLPAAIVVAAQIGIVAIAPSVAPSALVAGGASAATAQTRSGTAATGASNLPATGTAAGTSAAGAAASGAAGPVANSGDTSHCTGGREFPAAIAWYAPPCEPGTPGAPYPANGGATYKMGVTGDQVEIVDYVTNYGAEINAILQAQGALVDYYQESKLDRAIQTFVNKNFVTWGRKIHIDTYQGTCNYQDDNCILPEIDSVVQRYHPYMFFWLTPVCPECFSEIAHDGSIAIGGLSFSADFSQANAPFFYDSGMTSTQVEEQWAEWWCNSMSSANDPSRVVKFSSDQNAAQKLNGRKRVLGFISPNKPDDENSITGFLYGRLHQLCGEDPSTFHHYFYAQDINTAAQQVSATMAAMDTPTNPATDVLCVCDIVAPEFLYQGEANNNYWPENMVADTQGMGLDLAAQNYDASFSCPNHAPPDCAFDDAVGITVASPQEPAANDPGMRIWHAGCGCSGGLPSDSNGTLSGQSATDIAQEFVMMAALIENAGPQLDPWSMQKAALHMPAVGGAGHPVLQFTSGGYNPWHWTQDARVGWWDPMRPSSYNQKPGTWVSYPNAGAWYAPGGFPTEPGGPAIPPAAQRRS